MRNNRLTNILTPMLGAAALLAGAPLLAEPRGDEPVAVPRAVRQGIDFVYVDPKMASVARRHQRPQNWLARTFGLDFGGGRRSGPNPVFVDLARGLQQYQATWGRLPQDRVTPGAALKRGSTGKRVTMLRTRLGLTPAGGYDEPLFQAVANYQRVHGLGTGDGVAGKATINSLNAGAGFYQRRIAINMERAFRLPTVGSFNQYVVVDSGSAEAMLFERDRPVDKMRVVVGSKETKTPMMAVILRDAKANPYWNVPPELVKSLTAKRIKEQGLSYLRDFHYEVLADWSPDAQPIDPARVDWKGIASGKVTPSVHVRQMPGPWNSMGKMKFEMPNDYGIYLHDSPHKELFDQDNRWVSNGCVRLQDYRRFAAWVFGRPPESDTPEERFDVPRPVPVYMTYLTVAAGPNGVTFRPDPYGFDALAMPQMFDGSAKVAAANGADAAG